MPTSSFKASMVQRI